MRADEIGYNLPLKEFFADVIGNNAWKDTNSKSNSPTEHNSTSFHRKFTDKRNGIAAIIAENNIFVEKFHRTKKFDR